MTADDAVGRPETLVVEEPLEIRVNGTAVTVTMRTPGSDIELAQGFLLTEGVVTRREDVLTVRYCKGVGPDESEHLQRARRDAGAGRRDARHRRHPQLLHHVVVRGLRQGLSGRGATDQPPRPRRRPVHRRRRNAVRPPRALARAQKVFASTGGLHGAALFGVDGTTLVVREDIGRHNAVDKVIGWALEQDRIPLTATVLLVSGRASFELTQKAVMAGIPILAAVSAPSSLAVDLASQSGLTLVAFLRGESMNIYTRPDRVAH